jgi:ABC-type bacteriocin/lantibiotic exporter with double-glycine peptidase domain
MVLQYWDRQLRAAGKTVDPAGSYDPHDIAQVLGSTARGGTLGSQMKRYLLARGYETFVIQPEWSDLEHHLLQGRPLITALDNSGDLDHYVVLVGWDSQQDIVFVNDPARRKLLKLTKTDFKRSWDRSSRWTLLAVPRTPSMNALSASDGR